MIANYNISIQNRRTDVRNPKSENMASTGENGLILEEMQVLNGKGSCVRRSKLPVLASRICPTGIS